MTPGGWAEFQEVDLRYYSEDGSLTESNNVKKWNTSLMDAARRIGRDPCPGPQLENWVKEAGFTNITRRKFKLPIGPWPKDPKLKEIGIYNLVQHLQGLEGFTLRLFCDVLGWRKEEVYVFLANVRKDLKSQALHVQYDL